MPLVAWMMAMVDNVQDTLDKYYWIGVESKWLELCLTQALWEIT